MQRYKIIIDFAKLDNVNVYDLYNVFQNDRDVEADVELYNIHYLSYFGGEFNELINSIPAADDTESKLKFFIKVDGSTVGYFSSNMLNHSHIRALLDRNVELEINNLGSNRIGDFFIRP